MNKKHIEVRKVDKSTIILEILKLSVNDKKYQIDNQQEFRRLKILIVFLTLIGMYRTYEMGTEF